MINSDFINEVSSILNMLFSNKKDYNLISTDTWYRYSYCLKRLSNYLKNKEFDNFDEFILIVSDWETKSPISTTIRKKFIDASFIVKNKIYNKKG